MQKVIAKVEFGLCFALVAFQLYTAYFGNLFGIAQKAVHIGLIMSIIALGNYLKSDGHKMAPIIKPLSIFICLFGLFFAAYLTSIARALSVDMTTFTPLMKVVGIIFILILQQLDGNILTPKILGDSTGLASLWVIISVLVGGGLFGPIGMLLGCPAFALLYALIRLGVNKGLEKRKLPVPTDVYREEGVPKGEPEETDLL